MFSKIKILKIKDETKEEIFVSKKELKQLINESILIERSVGSKGINYLEEFYKNKNNSCYYLFLYDLKKKKYVNVEGVNL